MLFVACGTVAGTHGARVELTTVTVVVAHLDGLRKTAGGIATGARRRSGFTLRIVLDVPGRPVEGRLEGERAVGIGSRGRRKAKQRNLIHLGRVYDLPGIEEPDRIKVPFNGAKSVVDRGAELPLYPFTSAQAVAVLPAVRA